MPVNKMARLGLLMLIKDLKTCRRPGVSIFLFGFYRYYLLDSNSNPPRYLIPVACKEYFITVIIIRTYIHYSVRCKADPDSGSNK